MSEPYDARETQSPEAREAALFEALRKLLARVLAESAGWKRHLAGVDPDAIRSREDLARLPILCKSDLPELQSGEPPFAGLTLSQPGRLARIYMSPGPIFDPEGFGTDWWGSARAFHALGLRAGDILHNSFSYHLTPAGAMFETGAHALGCPVVPAGIGNSEAQVEAIERLRPRAYVGTPDFLKVLLDKAEELGRDVSSLELALVSGAALPPSLREEFAGRGITVRQAYGTADLGIFAFETEDLADGMVVNEDVLVEIVRPGTGEPLPPGEVGEVVVTRLNPDYPLIRFATGDLSAVLDSRPTDGRTNLRIKGWMGRADQTTKIKGMFVRPGQVAEIAKRHPEAKRLRLVVGREGAQDVMILKVEAEDTSLASVMEETLQQVTKLRGAVEIVAPGSLPNDGRVIADERSYD